MGDCPVQRQFAAVTGTSGHGQDLIHTEEVTGSKPAERDQPFSAWSLSKLAEFLVAEVPYL